MEINDISKTWPKHFDEAIQILNWHILPALKFTPKELMLGLVINMKQTNIEDSGISLTIVRERGGNPNGICCPTTT